MNEKFFLALSIAWALLIFIASSLPGGSVAVASPWDKLAHFGAYAVLAFSLRSAGAPASWAWFLAAAYGVSDEFHQSFIPGRTPCAADWLADALGALAGCVFKSKI